MTKLSCIGQRYYHYLVVCIRSVAFTYCIELYSRDRTTSITAIAKFGCPLCEDVHAGVKLLAENSKGGIKGTHFRILDISYIVVNQAKWASEEISQIGDY